MKSVQGQDLGNVVEVTPEMVEAGAHVIGELAGSVSDHFLARQVYKTMSETSVSKTRGPSFVLAGPRRNKAHLYT